MLPRRSDRERQRRAFLHALATGSSVSEAGGHAGIAWSTLYAWRQKSASFAAAWDRAAMRAHNALIDRMQSALIQRGVEGVDEPVFHAGKQVGTRKRYSDALLLAGLHEMTPPRAELTRAAQPVRPRVIIEPLVWNEEDDAIPPTPIPAPETNPADDPAATAPEPAPPEPAEEHALDWSHLGSREDDGRW